MNPIIATLLSIGGSFLFLCVLFGPLQAAFPAKPGQRFLRPDFGTDLCFFLGQYLLFNGMILWLLEAAAGQVDAVRPAAMREFVSAQPLWLQAIGAVVVSDFCVYWGHRLQHNVGFLWRFHKVHHTAEHLDWLAAHREHPMDTIYTTVGLINLPVILLGFSTASLGVLIAFRGLWAIFIHSNTRIPLGPFRVLVGSPELHHWHHAKDRFAGNYANLSPLMDWIFGTYSCPDHEPEALGIEEPTPRGYLGQMLEPMGIRFTRVMRPLERKRMASLSSPSLSSEGSESAAGADPVDAPEAGSVR